MACIDMVGGEIGALKNYPSLFNLRLNKLAFIQFLNDPIHSS